VVMLNPSPKLLNSSGLGATNDSKRSLVSH